MGALRKVAFRSFVPGTPGSAGSAAYQVCTYSPPPVVTPPVQPPPNSGTPPPSTCVQTPAIIDCDYELIDGVRVPVRCRVVYGIVCSGG